MPFISEQELENWASPKDLDAILLTKARLAAKLESRTSPLVYLTIGAIGGVLYYMARKQMMTGVVQENLATAVEAFHL